METKVAVPTFAGEIIVSASPVSAQQVVRKEDAAVPKIVDKIIGRTTFATSQLAVRDEGAVVPKIVERIVKRTTYCNLTTGSSRRRCSRVEDRGTHLRKYDFSIITTSRSQ